MRCHSISTITTDGYRAGSELGEGLRPISPEVVLLFASINYQSQFHSAVSSPSRISTRNPAGWCIRK